jgi:pimeloyl-ACP methyl ester carboxylesterase
MVGWLRKGFGKQKVFVLAHSAGTYVGLELALRHRDWVYAYSRETWAKPGRDTHMPAAGAEHYVVAQFMFRDIDAFKCERGRAGIDVVASGHEAWYLGQYPGKKSLGLSTATTSAAFFPPGEQRIVLRAP